MKLLLTSSGLGKRKLKKEFLKLLDKPVKETKVLFMTSKKKHGHLRYSIKELISIGIKKKNIFIKNLGFIKGKVKNLPEFDVFYSYGGNTFYILNKIKKTGFDKIIRKHIKKGKLYIGLSAGSILVNKTIEFAGWGSIGDINKIRLKNLRGLNFTNIAVWPHYKNNLKKELKELRKKVKYPIVPLKDEQALLILDKKKRFLR